jgi:hypothetical protein
VFGVWCFAICLQLQYSSCEIISHRFLQAGLQWPLFDRSMASTDHDVATALYTLTLGVLGFIPYPDVPVRVKKA